ncbi:MAG: DnaJ domain-containing protein [Synechococcaceae cyanobacterium]|nr:DnaJ domain-containing protein [Synechococcaceae cyanobacterium]
MESDRVTRNREALLLENEALRAEVAALRDELRRLRARGRLDGLGGAAARVTTGMAPAITTEQVREWLEGLSRQTGWTRLRVDALRSLIAARRGRDARGELEDELDRRSPGLGSDLRRALRTHTGKGKHAVRAAFARYGPRAAEWLSADPRRVVADLLADLEELESRHHHRDPHEPHGHEPHQPPPRPAATDAPRHADLAILGLGPEASLREVKAAHRRLVKRHHPDVGGDAETFRRIDAAYRRLIA